MANVRISWNMGGFREIRTSMARGVVMEAAARVQGRAGEGYAVDSYVTGGKGRIRAIIYPATFRAMKSNKKHNTLARSL